MSTHTAALHDIARIAPRALRPQEPFEDYPGCPNPPPIPVQSLWDADALDSLGIVRRPLVGLVVRAVLVGTGFARFQKHLPQHLDRFLQRTDIRCNAYGPAISGTLALRDTEGLTDAFVRAASLMKAAWSMHADIRAGNFCPDSYKGQALESRQFLNLFGTHAILKGTGFRLHKSSDISHALVLARGRFFIIDVGADTTPSLYDLAGALRSIWKLSASGSATEAAVSPAVVSCACNAIQSATLRALLADNANARSYERLCETFLTVCLDLDAAPSSYADAILEAHSRNYANRWFQSTLQLVVFANARASLISTVNAVVGGNTISRTAAEIQRRSIEYVLPAQATTAVSGMRYSIEQIPWRLDEAVVAAARRDAQQLLDGQQPTFELDGLGRSQFETRGFEPVPAFIIALQLATYRLTKRILKIRQFVSTTKYRYQTMNTAVVSTPEVCALLWPLLDGAEDRHRLAQLVRNAIDSQKEACRRARSAYPLKKSLDLFLSTPRASSKYVRLMFSATMWWLRRCRLVESDDRPDILASHPDIREEVPLAGRPGVRCPYVKYFSLHYQIHPERITLVFMPSMACAIPNSELAAEIRNAIHTLFSVCERPSPGPAATSHAVPVALEGARFQKR